MRHVRPRVLFALGAICASVLFIVASFAVLRPASVPPFGSSDVAVANVSRLPDRVPVEVTVTELAALERRAFDLRAAGLYKPMGPRSVSALPVYLVRDDGIVRAFIGLDPRNACPLDTTSVSFGTYGPSVTAFYDVCHGSLYGLDGERLGGPSPWTLDELVASIRDGVVYLDRTAVKPGRLAP